MIFSENRFPLFGIMLGGRRPLVSRPAILARGKRQSDYAAGKEMLGALGGTSRAVD
jgi:hypothetical protein